MRCTVRLDKMKQLVEWLKSLSVGKKVLLGMLALFILAGISGSHQPTNLNAANSADKTQSQQNLNQTKHSSAAKAPTVTTKTETETQSIPFTTTTANDSTLAKGTTKVTTAGVNGSETLTYQITYTNGKQTDKKFINTAVDQQPVAQVTSIGTYVAPAPAPTPSPQPQTSCTPLTNGGNCYEPGEYCRNSDHGSSGVAGDGENITCTYNNGWRWEPY